MHPRRSVLMRVLGDVDATPEIDTAVQDSAAATAGCSAPTGSAATSRTRESTRCCRRHRIAHGAAERLVKESLDVGAPDNVTVVVVDIDETEDSATDPTVVGSAAAPLSFESEASRRSLRLPTLLLHPLKVTLQEDSHFEPESDEYLNELIEEDRRRAIRRRIGLAGRHRTGDRGDRHRADLRLPLDAVPLLRGQPTANRSPSSRACSRTSARSRCTACTRKVVCA